MKKNLFYLFTLMAVAAMPLTSCEKDLQKEEDAQHDPKSDSDQTKIATYDALSWLQGSIVVVDDNDKVIRRIYGKPLDESQPDVISVPVVGYGAAEKIFLSWVAPGKEAVKVDGGYDYNLTDADGKDQGNVAFRVVEDEDGGNSISSGNFTQSEILILQELAERREALDLRSKEIDKKALQLKVTEKEIDKRLKQMKEYEQKLRLLIDEYNAKEKERIASLVKVYSSMKPKEAARIFETLDLEVTVSLLKEMKPSVSSAILAQISPSKAKDITDKIIGNAF